MIKNFFHLVIKEILDLCDYLLYYGQDHTFNGKWD